MNSIRILTIISPEDHKPFIASAVKRIGNNVSKPVDNWSASGISAHIDINNGILSKAALFKEGSLKYYSTHPDTGSKIEGTKVPNWGKIKDSMLKLSSRFPYLPYVARNVVPLDDEILIIEANNCSDVSFLQIRGTY